jgi:hypothetical protein
MGQLAEFNSVQPPHFGFTPSSATWMSSVFRACTPSRPNMLSASSTAGLPTRRIVHTWVRGWVGYMEHTGCHQVNRHQVNTK